jgi:hypothetical protein
MVKHNSKSKKQRGGTAENIVKPTSTGTSWSLMQNLKIPSFSFLTETKPPVDETKSSENDEKNPSTNVETKPSTNVETKPPANVETKPPAGEKSFWFFGGGKKSKKSKKTKHTKKSKKSKTQKRH